MRELGDEKVIEQNFFVGGVCDGNNVESVTQHALDLKLYRSCLPVQGCRRGSVHNKLCVTDETLLLR